MDPTLHNPSSVAGPPEYRECFRCSFRGEIAQTACPQCGKKLYTARNIRNRGIVQIITGLILVVMMVGLGGFLAVLASQPAGAELAKQKMLLLGVYGFFAVITLFGLNGIAMGTWQVVFGKRNKVFIWIMIILLIVILIACLSTVVILK
ncbi:MAG TPA: hypothetical protein VEV84_13310 [Pyrinomonadaceae bacterium]|jgi:hypothetical protein|nr:hypothetical protein [Pyrinomonadaceae bacterium]